MVLKCNQTSIKKIAICYSQSFRVRHRVKWIVFFLPRPIVSGAFYGFWLYHILTFECNTGEATYRNVIPWYWAFASCSELFHWVCWRFWLYVISGRDIVGTACGPKQTLWSKGELFLLRDVFWDLAEEAKVLHLLCLSCTWYNILFKEFCHAHLLTD